MARPFWTGQIQISLVSFSVSLFPATESKSEIRFHQLSRATGERIRHQKVTGEGEEGPVEKDDIVKGYEYRKGEYVMIEPDEIKNLRIPSKHTIEVTQFVDDEGNQSRILREAVLRGSGGRHARRRPSRWCARRCRARKKSRWARSPSAAANI